MGHVPVRVLISTIFTLVLFVGIIAKFLRSGGVTPVGQLPFYAEFLYQVFKPFFGLVRTAGFGLGLNKKSRWAEYIRSSKDSAGLYTHDEEDLMAFQVTCGGALWLAFALLIGNPVAAAPTLLIGAYYPIALLHRLAEMRKQAIFAELPYVLDLLSLGIEAGLDFKASVESLVNFSDPSPLLNELQLMLNELQLGTPMEETLSNMRKRIDILAFFTFVEALIQATQIGIDVSSTLRAQAEQMRITYFQNVEKQANSIPIKILLPSVIFIFPPLIFVVLGPIVLEMMNNPAFKHAQDR